MNRKEELLEYVGNNVVLLPLVDEMIYLEGELDELRKLPKIRINPKDKTQQKKTPAAALYKDFLQQYISIIKTITKATGADESEDDSPLRKWLNDHKFENKI